jgi:hypothetical protein
MRESAYDSVREGEVETMRGKKTMTPRYVSTILKITSFLEVVVVLFMNYYGRMIGKSYRCLYQAKRNIFRSKIT